MSEPLSELLDRARVASLNERIDLRDRIAAHGADAIASVSPWLADDGLWRFAVRVIGKAAEFNVREGAVSALREAGLVASGVRRQEIEAELNRLGAPGIVRTGRFDRIDHEAIRERLIKAAKLGDVVYYSDLAKASGRQMSGPHWAVHFGRILGQISSDEVEAGRPMLSAIVVSRDTKAPGEGFYNLGQELGAVDPGEDEAAFVGRETRRVYEYWQGKGAAIAVGGEARGRGKSD